MTGKSSPYKTCSGKPKAPICPYCNAAAVLHTNSAKFYRGKDFGPLWACEPCQAWVGCHPGKHTAQRLHGNDANWCATFRAPVRKTLSAPIVTPMRTTKP